MAASPAGAVLVTGASRGIGGAIARELSGRAVRVFGTVRRGEDAAALLAAGITPVTLDVTDAASVARAEREVDAALGTAPLAGLVNNAGIPGGGPLEAVALDELRRVFEVNVVGVLAVTQAFLPRLRASRGRIVNISSVSGRIAFPFMGPYAASKFALEALSDSLRREVAPFGVTVTVVQAGSVRTPIWERLTAAAAARYGGTPYAAPLERVRERALAGAARGLAPETVARAVARVLAARRPPARVLVVRSRARTLLMRALPDRVLDLLVRRALGG